MRIWLNELFRYVMMEKELVVNPSAGFDIVAMSNPKVRHNPHRQTDELPEFLHKFPSYEYGAGFPFAVARRSARGQA